MNVFQSIKVSLGALLLALVASAMLTACSSDEETTEAPPTEETRSQLAQYERFVADSYPGDQVVFAAIPMYPRGGGIREFVFHSLCRKNLGCSHFMDGYAADLCNGQLEGSISRMLANDFPDLEITIVEPDAERPQSG